MRKDLVFNKVTNPKVSEIQNRNESYLIQKGRKKILEQCEVSADQAEWNNFENKKKKMLLDNGVNLFSILDDTSRGVSGMSDGDLSHKDNGLTGQLNNYFRKKMSINLGHP